MANARVAFRIFPHRSRPALDTGSVFISLIVPAGWRVSTPPSQRFSDAAYRGLEPKENEKKKRSFDSQLPRNSSDRDGRETQLRIAAQTQRNNRIRFIRRIFCFLPFSPLSASSNFTCRILSSSGDIGTDVKRFLRLLSEEFLTWISPSDVPGELYTPAPSLPNYPLPIVRLRRDVIQLEPRG